MPHFFLPHFFATFFRRREKIVGTFWGQKIRIGVPPWTSENRPTHFDVRPDFGGTPSPTRPNPYSNGWLATPTQDPPPLKKARRGAFLNADDLRRQVWGRGGREVNCTWPRRAEITNEILVGLCDAAMYIGYPPLP